MKELIYRWILSTDRVLFFTMLCILCTGVFLIITASPSVAIRIGAPAFHFVNRHIIFISMGVVIMLFFSILNYQTLKKAVTLGLLTTIIMIVFVLFYGEQIKGSTRWISFFGISVQPSEFLKCFYIPFTGFILSEGYNDADFPSFLIISFIHFILVGLLLLQPDFGMTLTISVITGIQFFIAGIDVVWIVIGSGFLIVLLISAYAFMPHVAARINKFLHPDISDTYQVDKSLDAFVNGGFFGTGPGEGKVKLTIPDVHTDFIFSAAGEELGAIFCILLVMLYAVFVLRLFSVTRRQQELYKVYVLAGIASIIGFQSIFNMGVTMSLFPTKGMTLPFISYGGSSTLSTAVLFGIAFNFTRREHGIQYYKQYHKKI